MPDLTDAELDKLIKNIGLKNRGGRPRQPIHHGELRGAKQHRYRGEKPCDACQRAEAKYQRDRHRARYHPDWTDPDTDEQRTYWTEEEWQQILAARKATSGGGQR